ncbi:glycosyltransferase family A protein [Ligilactobacillus salivarius]
MEHKYKLYQYRLLQASNGLDDRVTEIVKLDSFEYSRTLDSALLQKYQDIEVRVIDTSHDNRVKRKVKQLQLYHPNLKYYESEEDADASRIINFIVKNAKEYVFFVESPYALESNTIYDLVEIGREHQADIVSAKNSIFKLSEKKYYYYASRDNEVKDLSVEDNLNSLNGCLIKKEIFDKVGTVDFDDDSSIIAILEKADKIMVKNSDYLVKVVE